ncbi:MAG: signal peptidase I [Oscillospiraceae bacterium]|nr:signal peptidase I [Oscillospiraceae bacterium]
MKEQNDLQRLSRKELVALIHALQEDTAPDAETAEKLKQAEAEHQKRMHRAGIGKVIRTVAATALVAAAAAVLLSTIFLPVIQISGSSMEPSLHDGDIVLLWKGHQYAAGQLCCISWQNKLLVKRVIAQGGETVDMDESGNVYVNDTLLDEPYLKEKSIGECDITFPYIVPEGTVFVLGDSRASSVDSRSSVIGCVTNEQIVGRVLFRVWPL